MPVSTIIIILLSTFTAGFGSGYWLSDTITDAEKAGILQSALIQAEKKANASVKVEKVYVEAETKTEIIYETIIKEVPKYVTVIQSTDSDCNLSSGTTRLLNMSASNEIPESTAITDEADKIASSVRASELIQYTHDSINKYNQVKDQCNALIDWVKAMGSEEK